MTSKLTLNYGLRLDRFINIRELNNEIGYFDPTISNPGAGGIPGAISFFGTGPGRNGMHNIGPAANAWSPRFGFAYSVTPKTVFRAAYGLASSAVFGLAANGGNLPATGWSWAGSVSSADRGVTPVFNWTQTKGFPLSPPPLPDLDPAILNGGSPQTWYPNDIRPARSLARRSRMPAIEVGYVDPYSRTNCQPTLSESWRSRVLSLYNRAVRFRSC